jgi:hypothetical protein
MRVIRTLLFPGLIACAILGAAGQVRAQTTLLTNLANGSFTYGDTSFTISGCNYSAGACTADNAKIITVFNGRGGTEIEIAPQNGSAIFSNAVNAANTTLRFTLKVTPLAGSRGLSAIQNILAGSAGVPDSGNTRVTSLLDSFSVVGSPTSISSNLNTTSTGTSFALTSSPVTFNVSLAVASSGTTGADTLQLNNVKLWFTPAPEPASIALVATGLIGLSAARRRSRRTPALAASCREPGAL